MFFDSVAAVYDLDKDEVEVLYQSAEVMNVLGRIHDELASAPSMTVRGSTGQVVAHPLLAAAAQQQRVLLALLERLGLSRAEDAPADLPADVVRLLPRKASDG